MIRPGIYQHYKGGRYLVILSGVQDSTNRVLQRHEADANGYMGSSQTSCVVYASLDSGGHQGQLCVREEEQFLEKVDTGHGVWVPRFEAL
jgi:hypothetical protein